MTPEILDLDTGQYYDLVEGTYIRNVQVFAGKGTRTEFRDAWVYAEKFGGQIEDWQHVKGIGMIDTEDGIRKAEIHWVQSDAAGRREMFIKEWLD